MKKIALIFLFTVIANIVYNQSISQNINQEMSPNGIFDEVFDRFGTKYSLEDIRIDTRLDSNNVQKSALLCSGGYFDLYFEANSGMDGSSPIEVARRNVICQLFNDLSQFIVPANPSVKVNIWVRDVSNFVSNPATSGVLGLASGFYTVPSNAPTFSGIVDNEIWKTINSGTNSYTNVTSPLNSLGGLNASFYHGVVAFNFSNPSINWHTDLSQTTLAGLYDMYAVALHEATHALGFASLIDANGGSKLGVNNQYYARYDLFLQTSTNQSLITNTGSCSLYNFGFNTSLNPNVMTPSPFSCATHIQFGGSVNQAAYSPSIFAPPSSLSHLEDMCHTPNSFPNNEYYVMSDANGTGATYMKRFLKPEERNVLCDIGYTVNTTYGNATNLNFFNYGGTLCPGLQIAGINDGINVNATFTYTVTVGATIPINGILSNDFNAVSFECLEDIYGNGTPNVTSGTTFNYTATVPGIALLRYIPVSGVGNRGNITYILILVQPTGGNCSYTPCNLIPNGDFESTTSNCAQTNLTNSRLNCWTVYSNSPDLYGRNCTNATYDIPSGYNNPPSDTWNNGANNNDHYLGMFEYTPGPWGEASQVTLSTGLVTGNTYQLKFWARVSNNYQPTSAPFALSIVASPAPIQIAGPNFNSTAAGLTPVIPSIIIPNNNQWNYIVQNFTYTGLNGLSNFIIGADPQVAPTANVARYILLDDIELIPAVAAGSFNPPSIVCINQILPDLSLFATPSGGVFSGNGVVFNSGTGIYSFDPSLAGVGNHIITYTYTSNIGCVYNIFATITVVNSTMNLSVTASSSTICSGESVTLTASGGTTYLWNPGNFSGNPYVVSPTTTTTYTVTGTDANGCSATSSVTVTVDPNCCGSLCNPLPAPSGILSATPPPFQNYCINNNITVTGNVTLLLSEFQIDPNVSITVDNNAVLTITGSHLYACDKMWQGIVVKPGGRVVVQSFVLGNFINRSSLIEDAFIAIDVQGDPLINNNPLTVSDATFNRNEISIQITDYSTIIGSTTYPMSITNTVFTSRDIPFTPNSLIWPHTNAVKATTPVPLLQSPYINNATYSPSNVNAYLKLPFIAGTRKPQAGIRLIRVGETQTPLTPIYHEIKIGAPGKPKFNVFDNLLIGIDAHSTNFMCVNNVFQNNPDNQKLAIAINAIAENLTNNRLRVIPAAGSNFANRFYDVGRAINSIDYYENIATHCDVRSSWNTTAPVTSPNVFNGKYGFIIETNRFKMVNFSNNSMYNIENGITLFGNFGPFQGGGPIFNGQYSGQININNNTIRPHLPGNTVTTQYVANAISVSNVVNANIFFLANSTINVNNNKLTEVYRGIGISSWTKKDVKTNNNTISLVEDAFTATNPTPLQYGIAHQANHAATSFGNSIAENVVNGFGITGSVVSGNPNVRAIVTALCGNQVVRCNTVNNTFKGIEFRGDNFPTSFTNNNMTTHRYGFVLDNAGFIGVQGNTTNPTDNRWVGAWTAPNFKTATLGGSTAIGSELWVRNTSGVFNPNGSGTTSLIPLVDDYFNDGSANSTLKYVTSNPIVVACNTISPCCPSTGKIARMEQVVQEQELLVNNIVETRYINKNKVYRMLRSEPDLLDSSIVLSDFYNNRLISNSETMAAVEEDFMLLDVFAAQAKTSGMTATNSIEQNYLTFFESYIKHQTDTINASDSLTLRTLAMGCPFTDGEVVYQARALFNAIYMSNVIFEDDCSSGNARMMGFTESSTNTSSKDLQVTIYPNPTTGETTLLMEGEENEWFIAVSDIQGRKIHEKTYTTNKINLKLVADNGIYFVHIINNNTNETITKKLIINK